MSLQEALAFMDRQCSEHHKIAAKEPFRQPGEELSTVHYVAGAYGTCANKLRAALKVESNAVSILKEIVSCDDNSDFSAGLIDGQDIDGGEQSDRLSKALAEARKLVGRELPEGDRSHDRTRVRLFLARAATGRTHAR